jgi:hypothetical protein
MLPPWPQAHQFNIADEHEPLLTATARAMQLLLWQGLIVFAKRLECLHG